MKTKFDILTPTTTDPELTGFELGYEPLEADPAAGEPLSGDIPLAVGSLALSELIAA